MAKPKNSFEELARDAATRLDAVREAGEQLTFLPDEAGSAVDLVRDKPVGRQKGSKNKASNQMREWLADKGYQMPEDVLAQMAGLGGSDDAILTAMQNAERVLAWSFAGQVRKLADGTKMAIEPSGTQRMSLFISFYTIQLRAADALLPYGAPKATPDAVAPLAIQINVPGAPGVADPAAEARVINPSQGRRMVPLDVAINNEQKQGVTEGDPERSDAESRTE